MRRRWVGTGLLVALVVAMALNTRFLTPAEVAAITPRAFDPVQAAADIWAEARSDLPGQAAPLGEVVPAFQADLAGAADTYGAVSPTTGSYVFPVTVDATVIEATDTTLTLEVPGVPVETRVLVPLGPAVNGTVVRDLMGFTFADAPGQTDYQYVGDELRKLMLAELDTEPPAALTGRQVRVLGAAGVVATGDTVPPAKPVTIQPVSIEVAP